MVHELFQGAGVFPATEVEGGGGIWESCDCAAYTQGRWLTMRGQGPEGGARAKGEGQAKGLAFWVRPSHSDLGNWTSFYTPRADSI